MENIYNELGFKNQQILQNPYGIKLYMGTKGATDWCVEIPNILINAKLETNNSDYKIDKSMAFYCITEEKALSIAKEFTKIAENLVENSYSK